MRYGHCVLNKDEKINVYVGQKIYTVEFIKDEKGGYWSKRFAAYNAKEAKIELLKEYPNAIYKRSKIKG